MKAATAPLSPPLRPTAGVCPLLSHPLTLPPPVSLPGRPHPYCEGRSFHAAAPPFPPPSLLLAESGHTAHALWYARNIQR
eukprot:176344-Chlamydomonas_euryale.AAC.7